MKISIEATEKVAKEIEVPEYCKKPSGLGTYSDYMHFHDGKVSMIIAFNDGHYDYLGGHKPSSTTGYYDNVEKIDKEEWDEVRATLIQYLQGV